MKNYQRDSLSPEVLNKILSVCGPGKLLYLGPNPIPVVRALLRRGLDAFGVTELPSPNTSLAERVFSATPAALPFRDQAFDTLIVHWAADSAAFIASFAALGEFYRVCRRYLILVLEYESGALRAVCEERAFYEGFRKHPAYYRFTAYEALQDDRFPLLIPLEKISPSSIVKHPLEALLPERPLHMDMSRETGARSDAHMARYDLAAQWVRAGDRVLDCACGLGYGTAMLASLSQGRSFLGVDLGAEAVAYALDNFGCGKRVSFRQGDAASLAFIANCSVDTVVCFETMEHLPDYRRFLQEARRILKPDGRIILSVPNLWHDETGDDPNPYHFHVFDLEKAVSALTSAEFIVEARYAQSAPGGFRLTSAPRSLERRSLEPAAAESDSEWWILIAAVDPLGGRCVPYAHPDFDRSASGSGFVVTDFARHYDNPWLYRPMVQMGERLADTAALCRLAQQVLLSANTDTAEYGAALTVDGYLLFDCESLGDGELDIFFSKACVYRSLISSNPHVLRWQVSLGYLSAQLALRAGRREQALELFSAVSVMDISPFSPLLATKTVAASFWAGIIRLVDGDSVGGRRDFENGVECARRALHAPDQNAIGNPIEPLPFGFIELSEVADMGGQCANALRNLDVFTDSPSRFWRSVDIRRFGLMVWSMALEKELSICMKELAHRESMQSMLSRETTMVGRLVNRTLERLFGVRLVRVRTLSRLVNYSADQQQ